MKTFLIVVGAVLAALFLFVAIVWWWIRRKLGNFGELLASLGGAAPPPFRVSLMPAEAEPDWSDGAAVAAVTGEFEGLGYERIADYLIPEMGDLPARAFLHGSERFYGLVYDHPAAGPIVDIVSRLSDGTRVTASSAPETGLEEPPDALIIRLDDAETAGDGGVAQIGRLHARLVEEVKAQARDVAAAEAFVGVFEAAYAKEMDWRIERRGPTADEVRRIAALTDGPEPGADEIQIVQDIWLGAIESFVDEEARTAYLAGGEVSAAQWEEQRERVLVVHEYCSVETRLEWLAWQMIGDVEDPDDSAHEAALERLGAVFEGRSFREGFREAQALLPVSRRYEPIGTVSEPWAADLYLEPADAEHF